jgi:hypothetical protein
MLNERNREIEAAGINQEFGGLAELAMHRGANAAAPKGAVEVQVLYPPLEEMLKTEG